MHLSQGSSCVLNSVQKRHSHPNLKRQRQHRQVACCTSDVIRIHAIRMTEVMCCMLMHLVQTQGKHNRWHRRSRVVHAPGVPMTASRSSEHVCLLAIQIDRFLSTSVSGGNMIKTVLYRQTARQYQKVRQGRAYGPGRCNAVSTSYASNGSAMCVVWYDIHCHA